MRLIRVWDLMVATTIRYIAAVSISIHLRILNRGGSRKFGRGEKRCAGAITGILIVSSYPDPPAPLFFKNVVSFIQNPVSTLYCMYMNQSIPLVCPDIAEIMLNGR